MPGERQTAADCATATYCGSHRGTKPNTGPSCRKAHTRTRQTQRKARTHYREGLDRGLPTTLPHTHTSLLLLLLLLRRLLALLLGR